MRKNELFKIPPNVSFPCTPYSEAHKNANNLQINQREASKPEKTFFEVRPKWGSVNFLRDQTTGVEKWRTTAPMVPEIFPGLQKEQASQSKPEKTFFKLGLNGVV